ncbi:MAG: hypothetical protein ACXVCP_00520 [Bdellovibrio sp.]
MNNKNKLIHQKVHFIFSVITALFFSPAVFADGVEAFSIYGSNPQMTEIGKAAESQNFNYNSYGTRQLGAGVLYNNDFLSLTVSDPRDKSSQRTDSSIVEFRSFGEIQWGIEFLHFKGFDLHNGTDNSGTLLSDRPDMEIYSSQLFILKNINNPDYSVQDALIGLKQVKESGWAWIFGGKISNTYLHGEQSIVPQSYSNTSANQINSYNLTGTIGAGGTFLFHNFYLAGQINLGVGPMFATWNDSTGGHQLFNYLAMSHIFDWSIGYSSEKWTVLIKISTVSDSTAVEGVKFENLATNAFLSYTYRF